jgi:crotonobetainyl-CoA:carnitine CoA-transferase CaiB-like acyl-CoA transferase
MAAVTSQHAMEEILADLRAATIPGTRILDIRQVRELAQVREKLTRTAMPDARVVHMQPMAVDVEGACTELAFPPKYGADTRQVLAEAGYPGADIDALAGAGVIA